MNRILCRLACALGFALGLHATAQPAATNAAAGIAPLEWPVSTAPARFTIVPDDGLNPPCILGEVFLHMPDPGWDGQPIRVFTDTGVAVGSDILWTAPGEPVTLLFDTSSNAKSYRVYLASNWPPMHLADTHAGIWMESRLGDGRVITKLDDMLDSWKKSTTVFGRQIIADFFEGGHRFGPQTNLFIHLQGWFTADKPEHLEFAPVSVDSSFVMVDGKEVVEWPGKHDWGYGPQGPPQGAVDVTPGIHVIDYYNAYIQRDGGRPPVLVCLSVKGGPYDSFTMLSVDRPFCRKFMTYHTTAYDLQTTGGAPAERVPPLAFRWEIQDYSPVQLDYADIGFVRVHYTCLSPPKGTVTWTFDDGTTADGADVTHVYARPGMRPVQVTVKDGDKVVATVTRPVAVHFRWTPVKYEELHLEDGHEPAIMARDPATMPVTDLISAFATFGSFHKGDDLVKLAPQMTAKMKDAKDEDMPFLKDAVLHLVHDDRDHFDAEEQLLRALIDRTGASTAPPLMGVASQSQLVLAQLLIKLTDQTNDVHKLIDGINAPSLTGPEPHALDILRGDLMLATGDVDGARKKFQDLTGDPQGADARSSIRRTAKISQARAFIERKDYDAAEDALREVSWQAPIEKLSPDWALTRLKLYEAEGLPQAGYLWAKRLMPVISTAGRSELLYRLTDLAFQQNDSALAHKTLDELLKKHPYSEEAARAKEKWPAD